MVEVCALVHLLEVVGFDISECTANDGLFAADKGDLVSVQQLLSNNGRKAAENVSLAVNNDPRHGSLIGKQIYGKFNSKFLNFIKIFCSNFKIAFAIR